MVVTLAAPDGRKALAGTVMTDGARPTSGQSLQRLSWLVFLSTLLAFSYFHAGGGWNQNVRFAMVRAIVEQGTVAVDDFLLYQPASETGAGRLRRIPIRDGRFRFEGRDFSLAWRADSGRHRPAGLRRYRARAHRPG